MQHMLAHNPGRVPRWEQQRLMQVRLAAASQSVIPAATFTWRNLWLCTITQQMPCEGWTVLDAAPAAGVRAARPSSRPHALPPCPACRSTASVLSRANGASCGTMRAPGSTWWVLRPSPRLPAPVPLLLAALALANHMVASSVCLPACLSCLRLSRLLAFPTHLLLLPQMLNWDWLSNRPAQPGSPAEALQPGWWHNAKQLLRPPLLDPSLPEEEVAAWVDAHTMRVHAGFLHLLPKLRRDAQTRRLVLDDPYWQQLRQLPAAQRQPAAPAGGSGPAASAAAPATAAAPAP